MTTKTTSSSASPVAALGGPGEEVDLHALLHTARADTVPAGWYVWPLRRLGVLLMALKWLALAVVGFALFIPAVLAMIPANYDGNLVKGMLSSVILVILGAVAFGALGLAAHDFWRAALASAYLLVMTPDHYVKFAPGKVTHVPMSEVAYVTMRGVRLPGPVATAPQSDGWSGAMAFNGMFFRGVSIDDLMRRNYRRAPASLAFMDLRNRREVIVATDDAFDALPILEQILQDYAHGIDYTLLR